MSHYTTWLRGITVGVGCSAVLLLAPANRTQAEDLGEGVSLESAKQIIESHITKLTSAAVSESEVNQMAVAEASLYERLSVEDRKAVTVFAAQKVSQLGKSFDVSVAQAGLSRLPASTSLTSNDRDGDSYAIGFVVCHIKCCKGGAGRGVAVGVGCWDCGAHLPREGCPR